MIGLWMIWRALSRHTHAHHHREGLTFGFMAGLIPCPLTLFIMNYAVLHKVVPVGILFAVSMMLGITLTLGTVALASVLFRKQVGHLLERQPRLFGFMSKTLEVLAGLVLLAVAATELLK